MISFDQINIILILAACLNFLLGIFIFFDGRKKLINKIYFLNIITIISWIVAMIFFRSAPEKSALLWCIILYVTPTLIASSFLHFTYIFPTSIDKNLRVKTFIIFTINAVIAFLVAVPGLVIEDVNIVVGMEKEIIFTKWYWFYIFYIIIFFSYGFFRLLRKYSLAFGIERQQILYLVIGYALAANFAFVTNLFLPWYGTYSLNWQGQPFTIVMVGFACYAIVKHQLFNMKVIATEIFTFLLAVVVLLEVIFANNIQELVLRIAIFVMVLGIGMLLIRSVIREVKQREQLQLLTNKLEQANKQLKILDKARAEFISIASHQLRTPPSTIKWYLAAILAGDYGKLSPKLREMLDKANQTNNGLINLIGDMLNVSRIERGKMEFLFEETDFLKMVDDAVFQLVPQAKTKKLELIFKKPKTKLPLILADKEKLQQVINNIIDNAIKYTKSGSVTVSLSKTASDIILKVQDTGRGMTAEERVEIFEKFKRGKESQKQASGLGLGLYVAKVIAEHHKGKIWAESEGLGKGSTFIVSLPIKTDLKADIFDLTKAQ